MWRLPAQPRYMSSTCAHQATRGLRLAGSFKGRLDGEHHLDRRVLCTSLMPSPTRWSCSAMRETSSRDDLPARSLPLSSRALSERGRLAAAFTRSMSASRASVAWRSGFDQKPASEHRADSSRLERLPCFRRQRLVERADLRIERVHARLRCPAAKVSSQRASVARAWAWHGRRTRHRRRDRRTRPGWRGRRCARRRTDRLPETAARRSSPPAAR